MGKKKELYKKVYADGDLIKGSVSGKVTPEDVVVTERSVLIGEKEPSPVPAGDVKIVENGIYDVSKYETAEVDVQGGITPTGHIDITENGDYDVTDCATAHVDVAGLVPTGSIDITTTDTVDVTEYATAQVAEANLVVENIKKDVSILGVVGTLEDSLATLMNEEF